MNETYTVFIEFQNGNCFTYGNVSLWGIDKKCLYLNYAMRSCQRIPIENIKCFCVDLEDDSKVMENQTIQEKKI
jgi:hypothetical protein